MKLEYNLINIQNTDSSTAISKEDLIRINVLDQDLNIVATLDKSNNFSNQNQENKPSAVSQFDFEFKDAKISMSAGHVIINDTVIVCQLKTNKYTFSMGNEQSFDPITDQFGECQLVGLTPPIHTN